MPAVKVFGVFIVQHAVGLSPCLTDVRLSWQGAVVGADDSMEANPFF